MRKMSIKNLVFFVVLGIFAFLSMAFFEANTFASNEKGKKEKKSSKKKTTEQLVFVLPEEKNKSDYGPNLLSANDLQIMLKDSRSCIQCHEGIESMHGDGDGQVGVTCVGCHGGNGSEFEKKKAHVKPRNKDIFKTSANPPHSYTALNNESVEFIRFMNPGDFRVMDQTCGKCHAEITSKILASPMAHSAMIPQAGLYNNGIHDAKIPVFGEAYMPDGSPAILETPKGVDQSNGLIGNSGTNSLVSKLLPLPRFEITPATDAFRVLERGNNDAGARGPGTDFHVAGGSIVLNKTRLNDPTLWFMGPNQTRGDYRSSGCTACHVPYANDRDRLTSGPVLAAFLDNGGKVGFSGSNDKSIPKTETGHPFAHSMTLGVPVSQCLTCHHHQGNGAIGSYAGAMWWDQETDAKLILNANEQRDESISEKKRQKLSLAGKLFDDIQFSDFNGHSWNFRKVFKRDWKGNLLDADGSIVPDDDPDRFKKAVHLRDIHFEKGMHCIDCHTQQDNHGDGRIWGAMADAIEIQCKDCHGTVTERATLVTSGLPGGFEMADRLTGARTQFGDRQFVEKKGKIIQHSKLYKNLQWEVPQLVDIVNPDSPNYNAKAARAKTLLKGGETWGRKVSSMNSLAHNTEIMECSTCHNSWNTTCYGCHLSAEVNQKADNIHYEGSTTRAYVNYNPQVVRSDGFVLGVGASSKGNKFQTMRSATAVTVTVRDRGRNQVVHQQGTIAASGYSGYAVSPNTPHTVRKTETRECSSCHISEDNNNNSWLASALGMGTNMINFIGEFAYVAVEKDGIQAVKVTEGKEPQPVIGSNFHSILHPESSAKFIKNGRRLQTAHRADSDNARNLATRGEFVFVADGPGGIKVFDRANIANKAKAQRLVENQNSGLGQKTRIKTKFATDVALPSTVPMNLDRPQRPENLETPIAELFRYAYFTDLEEGLIIVDVNTFTDHDPQNNHLERAVTFNPGNKLEGAVKIQVAGNYAYIVSQKTGLHVVNIKNPLKPELVASVEAPDIAGGRSIDIQFRYAFIADQVGMKVVEITDPEQPRAVLAATIELADARDVFVMRTYAYVAAGAEGLAIIDVEQPEQPQLVEKFTAGGQLNDTYAITTGAINASIFAFVADGRNGLRVLRLIEPPFTPGHLGYSPKPTPELLATFKTAGPAIGISEGAKRDRSIDESGNQIGVSGRLGSHPLRQEDLDKLLRQSGKIFKVKDSDKISAEKEASN